LVGNRGPPKGDEDGSLGALGLRVALVALASYLGIDRTVMTYPIDNLVKAGLVQRQQSPSARRNRRIVAAAAGVAKFKELEARVRDAEDHLLRALDPAGREHVPAAAAAPRLRCPRHRARYGRLWGGHPRLVMIAADRARAPSAEPATGHRRRSRAQGPW
jgi:DNA-binding MarR family transcriptional regulator